MTLLTNETIQYCFILTLGLSVALPLLLLNVKIAPRLGLVDWPKARGLAETPVPIMGHSLVLLSLGYLGILAYLGKVSGFVVASTFLIAMMGYFDDLKSRSPLDKMLVQLFSVVSVVLFDPALQASISKVYGPWGTFWAIFFILGLMNAINFIDGIDGLAGTVLFFGGAGLFVYSQSDASLKPITIYSALLMGMLIPFLYLNIVHRKGFLGNVGSYTLSYILAVHHLSVPIESGNIISRLALPGLCFLVPIADAAMVLVYRLGARRSPFQADKGHLHHRLMQASLPLRYILLVLGAIEAMGVIVGYLVSQSSSTQSPWLAAALCFSNSVMVGMLIFLVEKTSKNRVQAYFSHLDKGDSVYFLKYKISHKDGKPVSAHVLNRLEARINAEIRVTDLCFIQEPDTLFVTLRNISEPFKGFSARLERIFDQERVHSVMSIEQGEFIKVANPSLASRKRPQIAN